MIAAALLASAAMLGVAQPAPFAREEATLLIALSYGPPPLTAQDRAAPLPALDATGLTIAAPLTPEVEAWLRYYNGSGRPWFVLWHTRLRAAATRLTSALDAAGLPHELVYLALIESGLQEHAVSRLGAAGWWQLMPATARGLGLRVDATTDERFEPAASTDAALRLLTSLQRTFGDWHLALAAYNGGQETMARAIASAGTRDFFTLARAGALPPETANFVPKFIAAVLLGRALGEP